MPDMDNPIPIKPLEKNHYLVTQLAIVDEDGNPIRKPFKLQEGSNIFKCIATYIDGSMSNYEPYWSCPVMLKLGGSDPWYVFGRHRRPSITVYASAHQERYSEIGCWVFTPEVRGTEIVHDSASFDYSLIKSP